LRRQLPEFGRLAYPMHAEATKHVLLGRKSPGCPVAVCAAVGTIWGASKLGGLNITKCLQLRNAGPPEIVGGAIAGSRPILLLGKADDAGEETGTCTMRYRRGRGPSIPGRIRRDNVGKIPPAAGSGDNLQRLLKRGKTEAEKRGMGLAHESVGAMKEGQCPPRRCVTPPRQQLRWSRGKGTQDTWRSQHQRGSRTQRRDFTASGLRRGCGQTTKVGADAYQRLDFDESGKVHGRNARVSNRTWEIRPSGIIGGPRETWPWWK
jgi:hypothetical protein